MGVYVQIFALSRSRRPLRVPKLYLDRFAEFKNGIKVEFGAKMRILKVGSNPLGGGQSAKMKNGFLTNKPPVLS